MALRNAFEDLATEATLELLRQLAAARPRIPDTPLVAIPEATASGVTQLVASPGAGKFLRVHYLYFTPRSDPALVKVRFSPSGSSLFQGYAAGKSWRWDGAEDESLEAELDAAVPVAFTVLYEEVVV